MLCILGKPVPAVLGEGLVTRRILVPARDAMLVRAYLEGSEGLAVMFAESGGDLTLASPACLERELDAFIDDLRLEMRVTLFDEK